ncbi:MAG: hypothetical protein PHW89_10870 [Sulfurimonas denitrificans]|nr:hypothetical protein [Sulfurimonas denitrificans]
MPSTLDLVKNALSAKRISSYEQAKGISKPGLVVPLPLDRALQLYAWNAQISAAFMHPLHICEVVVRNGVANAIESVYGTDWPWSNGFEQSLPSPATGYNMRQDLLSARKHETGTGKVIPELKFAFWQRMFTGRHDKRLWEPYLDRDFPNFPAGVSVEDRRSHLFKSLEHIRHLRNRIAHHEPIYARSLRKDFAVIHELIAYRCTETASWMQQHQQVSALLALKPL